MRFRIALILFPALAASLIADDAEKKEFEKLAGTWVVVEAEKDGKPLDRLQDGTLTITNQNFAIKTASGFELKGDLRIDPTKKPKTVEFAHQDGVLRDKTWEGIYELKGDELKLCYSEADTEKPRPTEFKTEDKSGLLSMVLKRQSK
jgi:uncharacterized protein (TIGR03067 family)